MLRTYFRKDNDALYQFEPQDWLILKRIRLQALQAEPNLFGSSLEEILCLPDRSWQERLVAENRAYFGLFLSEKACIGLSAVTQQADFPHSVVLMASYIQNQHRGLGLSTLFYAARLEWAKAHGYTKAIVSHRETNLVSKAAIQRAGFRFTHLTTRSWPDGSSSTEWFYELYL